MFRLLGLGVFAIAAIVPAMVWAHARKVALAESVLNYKLAYTMPKGWTAIHHSPTTLFAYKNGDGVVIKGGHTQIVSDENPTPDLDRDHLSEQFAEVTRDNLGWKATMGDVISFPGGTYRLVRREGGDRTIISAVAVRGNTTILISMAGIGKAKSHVDEDMPIYKDFLEHSSLTLTHYE